MSSPSRRPAHPVKFTVATPRFRPITVPFWRRCRPIRALSIGKIPIIIRHLPLIEESFDDQALEGLRDFRAVVVQRRVRPLNGGFEARFAACGPQNRRIKKGPER